MHGKPVRLFVERLALPPTTPLGELASRYSGLLAVNGWKRQNALGKFNRLALLLSGEKQRSVRSCVVRRRVGENCIRREEIHHAWISNSVERRMDLNRIQSLESRIKYCYGVRKCNSLCNSLFKGIFPLVPKCNFTRMMGILSANERERQVTEGAFPYRPLTEHFRCATQRGQVTAVDGSCAIGSKGATKFSLGNCDSDIDSLCHPAACTWFFTLAALVDLLDTAPHQSPSIGITGNTFIHFHQVLIENPRYSVTMGTEPPNPENWLEAVLHCFSLSHTIDNSVELIHGKKRRVLIVGVKPPDNGRPLVRDLYTQEQRKLSNIKKKAVQRRSKLSFHLSPNPNSSQPLPIFIQSHQQATLTLSFQAPFKRPSPTPPTTNPPHSTLKLHARPLRQKRHRPRPHHPHRPPIPGIHTLRLPRLRHRLRIGRHRRARHDIRRQRFIHINDQPRMIPLIQLRSRDALQRERQGRRSRDGCPWDDEQVDAHGVVLRAGEVWLGRKQ